MSSFTLALGGAGGTKANVQRWYRQFKEPENQLEAQSEKITVGAHSVYSGESLRYFFKRFSAWPKNGQGWLCIVGSKSLEAPKGHIFIKFTGPLDLVIDTEKEFKEMVKKAKNIALNCHYSYHKSISNLPFSFGISKIAALMSSETTESTGMIDLLAWFETNKQKLVSGGVIVLIVALVGYFFQCGKPLRAN